ncbi:hypothetical protein [Cytobacillus firmus]|uniref:hypothetical protein n=1 Tax=Cytobacillus firmus TaxID=1399 RepID=UPI0021612CBC|nr:hypothetical protein [Cytobacillus firmus]
MNDAYNRIYRFHGRNDIDNLSIVEMDNRPVPFHLSQMDRDITKTSDSVINQDGNKKEQFSAPAVRSRKSKTKPLILPPPAIEARQIFRTSKNHQTANEKNTIKDSKEKKINESKIEENKILSEKQRIENLRASYLLTPYSPMLTWSPSLPSKNTSVRTQFFLANKSSEILEHAIESGNLLLPPIEKENDQKIDADFKGLNVQIGYEDETLLKQDDTRSFQDEFSLMLEETAPIIDEEIVASSDDEILQKDDTDELSNSNGLSPDYQESASNGSIQPFQMFENGLKLNAINLVEDFIHLLQNVKDGDQAKIQEPEKEELLPSKSFSLYYEDGDSVESESLQNDYSGDEDEILTLDEKFLLILTESSSDEGLYEDSIMKQDEAFALLTGYYSKHEESSSDVNVFSSKNVLDIKDESSSPVNNDFLKRTPLDDDYYQEETLSLSERQSVETSIVEKQVSALDNESSDEDVKGEFSRMLEKAYAILEVFHPEEEKRLEITHEDQPATIQEVFSQLLDEAYESSDRTDEDMECCESSLDKVTELLRSFAHMLYTANEQEYLINKESTSSDENCCLLIESSSLPIEHYYSETESDSYESSCNLSIDESSSIDESCRSEESSLNFEHHCDESEESSSGESSSHEESPNLQDEFEHELEAVEEVKQDSSCEGKQECVPKIPMPTVKIPVLIAKLDMEIDIWEIFPLHHSIKKITKLEWSISSLDTHAVLPSNIIFIKGTLIADIEYVNRGEQSSLHSAKIPIKFDTTSEVCWLFPPDMPEARTQKEYMFKSDGCDVLNSHYETCQYFTEKIGSQLRCINFVWHNDLTDTEKPGLQVQGRALLEIDLLQDQYVDLNRF